MQDSQFPHFVIIRRVIWNVGKCHLVAERTEAVNTAVTRSIASNGADQWEWERDEYTSRVSWGTISSKKFFWRNEASLA